MQEITAWLKTKEFNTGVALYLKHGSSNFLKQKFAAGYSAYLHGKLTDELSKLVKAAPAPEPVTAKTQKPAAQLPASPKPDPKADNTRYLQLLKKKERLYLEFNQLMEQKHYLPEGPELRDCALTILSRHQLLTETWSLIDHYQQHQAFPLEVKPTVKNYPPEKEIQLLRQSITKAKSRLKKETCRNREQTAQLLSANEARLKQLLNQREPS